MQQQQGMNSGFMASYKNRLRKISGVTRPCAASDGDFSFVLLDWFFGVVT
jgi:hypothetical protein